ncbi:Ig-like domain-containing protein, partial [Variovorax sp.]|uniref:Ig-like domain-containing protein n=1 Tax=Variovorax sp. TaxID=1871043 RepID=UPI002D27A420
MSSSNIELAVQSGKGESVAHRVGGRAGAPLHIKAQSGSNYLLKGEDGQAPENITLKRVGNNLEVTLEGDNQPGLIIENYFAQEPAPGLYGTDSSGQLHEFVRTDGEGGIFTLADGESEAAALGSAPAVIPEQKDGGMFVLFPLLAAASLAGLAAYAIGRDDDEPAPPPLGKTPDGVASANDDVGAITGPIARGGTTDDTMPEFRGRGTPGNTIKVYDHGQLIGQTTVDPGGNWVLTPDALADGAHSVTVTDTPAGGTESAPSAPFDFVSDTVAPAPSQNDQALDDHGDQQGPIAPGGITDDSTPTLSGDVEPGSQVVIEENGVPLGSATVDDNGHWEFTPDTPLADGAHELVP